MRITMMDRRVVAKLKCERYRKAGKADGFGMSYNAQCYSECRGNAVEFLKEAKGRLDTKLASLFDKAIGHYGIVAQEIKKVADTFPFFERKPEHITDKARTSAAIESLKAAKTEEARGLETLAEIAKTLGAENVARAGESAS